MSQTILEFRLDRDKHAVLQGISARLGIKNICVERRDYVQKLGVLAGVPGFSREKKAYTGPEFPAEMLVFSGMNSAQVDAFLDEYKKTGLVPIGLKAVVTADNVFWSAEKLYQEIMREHLGFTVKPG